MTTPNSTTTHTVQISYFETVRHTATIQVPVTDDHQDIWDAAYEHFCDNPVETDAESLGMDYNSFDVEPA